MAKKTNLTDKSPATPTKTSGKSTSQTLVTTPTSTKTNGRNTSQGLVTGDLSKSTAVQSAVAARGGRLAGGTTSLDPAVLEAGMQALQTATPEDTIAAVRRVELAALRAEAEAIAEETTAAGIDESGAWSSLTDRVGDATLEILVGFGVDEFGVQTFQDPVWTSIAAVLNETFAQEMAFALGVTQVLCRLVQEGDELVSFDSYFILTLIEGDEAVQTTTDPAQMYYIGPSGESTGDSTDDVNFEPDANVVTYTYTSGVYVDEVKAIIVAAATVLYNATIKDPDGNTEYVCRDLFMDGGLIGTGFNRKWADTPSRTFWQTNPTCETTDTQDNYFWYILDCVYYDRFPNALLPYGGSVGNVIEAVHGGDYDGNTKLITTSAGSYMLSVKLDEFIDAMETFACWAWPNSIEQPYGYGSLDITSMLAADVYP